jgi:formylmethanofuran dehydrogenase subunit B
MGKAWMEQPPADGPTAWVDGLPVPLEEAISQAADLLCQAKYPLVFGLEQVTCEAAARAVAIADWLGANLDTTASFNQGPTGLAFQGVGEIACSLGEVRNRADLVLFWGADPDRTHPRHTERYSVDPPGIHVPQGRKGRYVVVIDPRENLTASKADLWLKPKPGRDFELLWTLRALVQGLEVPGYDAAANGISLPQLETLAVRLKTCRFGVLFFGEGLMAGPGHHLNADAAVCLAHDINAHTRFYARPLRGAGNPTGSDSVTCWQTGYPFGINMSRGYPRFNPGEFTTRQLLANGEADAALVVGVSPSDYIGGALAKRLGEIPVVQIGSSVPARPSPQPKVTIRSARFPSAASGTVYRMDDISLPLKALQASHFPAEEEVLVRLEESILKRLRVASPSHSRGAV